MMGKLLEIELGKILSSKNDKSKQIKSSEYLPNGAFPVVDQSEKFICGYFDDEAKVISKELPMTVFGDHTRHVKFIDFPFICGADGTQLLKPTDGYSDKYLYYIVQRAAGLIGNYGYDRHFKHLKEFKVKVTNEIPEQTCIAEILSTADEAIAQTEALIAKYQRIKTGLMQDLLTRGIDANGSIRSKATHRFVVKNGIEVPVEWEVDLLMTNAEVYGGKRLPSGHFYSESSYGFKYLRVLDFYKKAVNYYSLENLYEETFEALKRYEIKPGELFISIAGSIGYIGVLRPTTSDRFILTENALRIVPNDKIIPEYLSLLMNSETVQKQIWSEIGTGGGVPKLALHRVQSLNIFIPSKAEQISILDKIQANDGYLKNLNSNLNKLHALKTGLMQDLLSGRVRVKVNNG